MTQTQCNFIYSSYNLTRESSNKSEYHHQSLCGLHVKPIKAILSQTEEEQKKNQSQALGPDLTVATYAEHTIIPINSADWYSTLLGLFLCRWSPQIRYVKVLFPCRVRLQGYSRMAIFQ
jgi:hypothetical protein